MSNPVIRRLEAADKLQWRQLWLAYCDFYQATVSEPVTEATWQRVLAPEGAMGCFVAEDTASRKLLGFVQYVIHPRTWSVEDVCYLEDLFVDPDARGLKLGYRLCEAIRQLAKERGLSQVYWNTQEHNHAARKLYDRIGKKDDFIRYVMPIRV